MTSERNALKTSPSAIMVFAAGFGTRMGALTRDRPKPLIPVGGVPMIDRALDLARAVHPTRIVANLHYQADQLAAHLKPSGVVLSHESEILETGGGLRKALPLLGKGAVYTMNPDVIWAGPNPLEILSQAWNPDLMDALVMCVPVANARGYIGTGDFTADQGGHVRRGPGLVYGGVQILKVDGLSDIPQKAFSFNVLWNMMMKKNRLYCVEYPKEWCDVGSPEGVEIAEKMLASI